MKKIKLNLRALTDPELVELSRRVVTSMTGNPNFTTPNPPLPTVTTGANTLEGSSNSALTSDQATKQKYAQVRIDREKQELIVNQLAAHVESVSGGDIVKIMSSGFDIRSTPAPVGNLPAPQNLSATEGDHQGSVDLGWDGPRGSSSFVVQWSPDSVTWTTVGATTKSSYTVAGLVTGSKGWFRVAAVGAAGQGPWSDPATKIVP